MYLKELTSYKSKLLKMLCSSQRIVDFVTNIEDSKVPNMKLLYKQILPYCYVPDVATDPKTFICLDIDVPRVRNGNVIQDMEIYIYIFTTQELVKPDEGMRIDLIASEVDKLLNGKKVLGEASEAFGVNLVSSKRFTPATGFQGRVLTYVTGAFNK